MPRITHIRVMPDERAEVRTGGRSYLRMLGFTLPKLRAWWFWT